jgi:phosphoglycerol transferase MdoB-like AlkP superfamily enzyme
MSTTRFRLLHVPLKCIMVMIMMMITTTTKIAMVVLVISYQWNYAVAPFFCGLRRESCILFSNLKMTWKIVKFETTALNSTFKLPSGMLIFNASYNSLSTLAEQLNRTLMAVCI